MSTTRRNDDVDAFQGVLDYLTGQLASESLTDVAESRRKQIISLLERVRAPNSQIPTEPNGDLPTKDNVGVSASVVAADAGSPPPTLPVYWSGYLAVGRRKQNSANSSPITWNRRWCVVKDDRLYCYTTYTQRETPQAEYSLRGARVARALPAEVNSKPLAIKVLLSDAFGADPIFFAVYVGSDMADCMQALTAAATGMPPLPPPPRNEGGAPFRESFLVPTSLPEPPPPVDDGEGYETPKQAKEPFRGRANTLPLLGDGGGGVGGARNLLPHKGSLALRKKRSPLEEPESMYEELPNFGGAGGCESEGGGVTPAAYMSDGDVGVGDGRFRRQVGKGEKRSSGRRFLDMLRGSRRRDSDVKYSADEMSAAELDDPTVSGYLMKKTSGGSWKKRWCVVKDHCFYYYRSQIDPKPQLAVVLRGWTVSRAESDVRRNFAFKLSHNGILPYYFAADSHRAMEDWIILLQTAIGLERRRELSGGTPSAPPTPARSSGSATNEMDHILKAVQNLGSPTSPPPLPSRDRVGANSSSIHENTYDVLGPPIPVPTVNERIHSPRLSVSSMGNDTDLYDVPRSARQVPPTPTESESPYNMPKLNSPPARTSDSENDIEGAYEPLNLKPPPSDDQGDSSDRTLKEEDVALIEPDAGTSEESPDVQSTSPRQRSTSVDILDGAPSVASLSSLQRTSEDEPDRVPFKLRHIKLPSKLIYKGGVVNVASLKTERPPRPSSIASSVTEIEGHLHRRGPFRRWTCHFCRIRYKKFYCFKGKDEEQGILTEFRLLGHDVRRDPKDVKRPYSFSIESRIPGQRSLIFSADTKEEFDRWYHILNSACSIQVRKADNVKEIHLGGGGSVKIESLLDASKRHGSRDQIDASSSRRDHLDFGGSMSAPEETLDDVTGKERVKKKSKVNRRRSTWQFLSLSRRKKKDKRPALSSVDFNETPPLPAPLPQKEINEEEEKESDPVPKAILKESLSDAHILNKKPVEKTLTDPSGMGGRARGGSFMDKLRHSFRRSKNKPPKIIATRQSSSEQKSVISGYLYVQKKSFGSSWMKCWCQVPDTEAQLLCFREMNKTKPINVVNLIGASVQVFDGSDEETRAPTQHMFRIVPGAMDEGDGKPMLFMSDNPYDIDTWVNALRRQVRKSQSADVQMRDSTRSRDSVSSVVLANPTLVSSPQATDSLPVFADSDEPPDPPSRSTATASALVDQDNVVYVDDTLVHNLFRLSLQNQQDGGGGGGGGGGASSNAFGMVPCDVGPEGDAANRPYYIDSGLVEGPRVTEHPYLPLVEEKKRKKKEEEESKEIFDGEAEYLEMGDDDLPPPPPPPPPQDESPLTENPPPPPPPPKEKELFFASASPDNNNCHGWLLKKGTWGAWTKHYFKTQNGKLLEYKNESTTTSKPERSVKLTDCVVEELTSTSPKQQRRHVFRVTSTSSRVAMTLATHTGDEKKVWIKALRNWALNLNLVSTDSEGDVQSDAPVASRRSPVKPPRRWHTFNVSRSKNGGEKSLPPRLRRKATRSTSPEAKTEKKRIGSMEKSASPRRSKSPKMKSDGAGKSTTLPSRLPLPPMTSGSEGDLSSSFTSMSELRMSFGKGKKKKKNALMIEKFNQPASALDSAYFKGYLYQKVSMSGWTRRWCALNDLCLHIYRHSEDQRPLETVILPGWEVHLTTRGKKRNVIKLWHAQMKSMYFTADHRSFVNWLTCLQEASVVRGGVGDLAAAGARARAFTYSTSSMSSDGEREQSDSSISTAASSVVFRDERVLSGQYDRKVEDVNLKHTAIHLNLFAKFETDRIEKDECVKLLHDLERKLFADGEIEAKKEECEIKLEEIEGRLKRVEMEMKENEEEKLRELKALEEEHEAALRKSGYRISNVPLDKIGESDVIEEQMAYVKKRDMPDDTPPHQRRPSLQAIGRLRVQEQIHDFEQGPQPFDSSV